MSRALSVYLDDSRTGGHYIASVPTATVCAYPLRAVLLLRWVPLVAPVATDEMSERDLVADTASIFVIAKRATQ